MCDIELCKELAFKYHHWVNRVCIKPFSADMWAHTCLLFEPSKYESASSQDVQMSIDQLYVNYVHATLALVLSVEHEQMNSLNKSVHPFYFSYSPSTKPALHKHS